MKLTIIYPKSSRSIAKEWIEEAHKVFEKDRLDLFEVIYKDYLNDNDHLIDFLVKSIFNSSHKILKFLEKNNINLGASFHSYKSAADFYLDQFYIENYLDNDSSDFALDHYCKYLCIYNYFISHGTDTDSEIWVRIQSLNVHKRYLKLKYIQENLK